MNYLILVALLLASLSWSSWSNKVNIKSGEDAFLSCRNVNDKKEVFWSRLVNNENYSCIFTAKPEPCEGNNNRFNISYNSSFVTLKIQRVEIADSGFYFCVSNLYGSGQTNVVQLNVEDYSSQDDKKSTECEGHLSLWISISLGVLCILLTMAIVWFALKVKKLQTAQRQELNGSNEDLANDNLNYAAVNFRAKARRTNKALHNDPNVIYAATR
ncbi:uncharacterized protein [Eucyclogobius newberryi]|uniref:uncharacterized protein n=1 Tax=Eucyclogobius newberryi TaxID=166745 RepID=UPI003B5BB52D